MYVSKWGKQKGENAKMREYENDGIVQVENTGGPS